AAERSRSTLPSGRGRGEGMNPGSPESRAAWQRRQDVENGDATVAAEWAVFDAAFGSGTDVLENARCTASVNGPSSASVGQCRLIPSTRTSASGTATEVVAAEKT